MVLSLEKGEEMKTLKIGLSSGINPLPAMQCKAAIFSAAAAHQAAVDLFEDREEMRADAPTPRIGLADRKIASLLSVKALEAAGCDEAILPDVKIQPYLEEVQKEVSIPIVPLFAGVEAYVKAKGIKRVGLLGSAVPAEYFKKSFGDALEWVDATEEELAEFEILQNPKTGLRKAGLTDAFKAKLLEIGRAMTGRGAQCLIPNCTQMARFATELQAAGLPLFDILRDAAERAVTQAPARQPIGFKIGMIGGLGPAATVDLYDKIVKATPAKTDQEHIKLVVEQNPQIPDRTAALLEGGEDPTLALFNCAKRLERDGCDAIIVPCNTAHAFVPYLERYLHTPFINMQQTALDEIKAKLGDEARIGLLATTGTVRTGIYGDKAKAMGIPLFVPDEAHQARVMAAIYGPQGAKAGYTDGICRSDLLSAAEYLVKTYDCNCLILGCTELPLILDESDAFSVAGKMVVVVDPTAALARRVVAVAEKATAERGVR